MVLVPVFLGTTIALALVNGWLIARTGKLRRQAGISVGDGGSEALLRRMRAQGNFGETAPLFLFLVLGLELYGANRWGLAVAAALFTLARISHAVGMEGGEKSRWRMYGMMSTSFLTIALILWAAACLAEQWLGR
ncbi:MAG TPA: MAPEG family protein [Sphingomicrobium sp.]|nr:MAPEG family protein [Sphingomicrobium sp.]